MRFGRIFLFVLSLMLFFLPQNTFASENFETYLDAVYAIDELGTSNVTFEITLTNKSETHFPQSYKMNLNFDDIKNLKAKDGSGEIDTSLEKISDGYLLELFLNEKPIGESNSTTVIFSFKTDSVVDNSGTAREINIPGVSNPDNFDKINITVDAPESFGKPSYTKPESTDLVFSKNEILKSGISIAYGARQTYKFTLKYHLKNPNFYPKNIEIALPPNTNYQEVFIGSIDTQPKTVTIDKDGNWLAVFSLSPLEKKDVSVAGFARISTSPSRVALTDDEMRLYTNPTKYWNSDDPEIIKLADELKTPEDIYKYVTRTLSYDLSRVENKKPRLGGKKALSNPESAVCLEFSDLFITLSRAAGIPAREINGFASTDNQSARPLSLIADVLHAWPEYYDGTRGTWVMVDPTWGNTTGGVDYFKVLDFNHFAFVIKGVRDDSPIPAGGYKSKNEEGVRDVMVELTDEIPDITHKVSIASSLSDEYIAGLPIKGKITVKNTGGAVIPVQDVTLISENLMPRAQTTKLPLIPPFGSKEVEIEFENKNILTNHNAEFTINYADEKKLETVRVKPFFMSKKAAIYAGIFTIIILATAYGFRRLFISGR